MQQPAPLRQNGVDVRVPGGTNPSKGGRLPELRAAAVAILIVVAEQVCAELPTLDCKLSTID